MNILFIFSTGAKKPFYFSCSLNHLAVAIPFFYLSFNRCKGFNVSFASNII